MRGRLEIKITVPVGGWVADVTASLEGLNTITIPAGDYHPSELLEEFEDQLNAIFVVTWTVTGDFGGAGSGKVTFTLSSGDISITWTSPDMRDCLGFTGNVVGAASPVVSTNGMQGVWIPKCPIFGPDLDPAHTGVLRTDRSQVRGARGKVWTYIGNTYRSFRNVLWKMVPRDRAVAGVDTAIFSWEDFVRVCLSGSEPYFPITTFQVPTVKVYFDADAGTVLGAAVGGDGIYYAILSPDVAMAMPVEGYVGYRSVEILELVKV